MQHATISGAVVIGHMTLGRVTPAGRGPTIDPPVGYFLDLEEP
jgi:hypothetical protein